MTNVAIRTPDQRVRVFVSSSLQELADERRAAREAIEGLHLTPVMFEQGARPHPPRALYRAYLEQSDVFIGLYWQRYGWVAPGEKVSGLEDEYGLSGDRPKLIYIKMPAPTREPELATLLDRIRRDDRASYRPFNDADELRSLVADDLAVLLTERFASAASGAEQVPGWRPPQLPRPATRLIGRDEDVDRVAGLLAGPETRLVTITGAGGIGKSRLALEVAERVKDQYADGVAYIELAAVPEPSLLLPSIARALGMEEGTGVSIGMQLRDRMADTRLLLVLDNMEQLADAADDVSDLVVHTHALQLLVTSRRVLDIRGERVFELASLAAPAVGAAITPAVELFLERARAIRSDFRPPDAELAAIAEICRRLDGLPLAIELASARVRILSPQAILERMGYQRLAFLRVGARDLPPHQRTLQDTIAWSYSLLSPDSQVLFARLAVFVGNADLGAIEQVTNPDGSLRTLDLLADLVDQSLVRAIGEAAEVRFGMLETIREFAAQRLEASGEAVDNRVRHETHYLELGERGDAALGSAEQIEWLDRFSLDEDNFRAVLRRALRRGDAVTALRMGQAMAAYWQMRGGYSEGRNWMEQIAGLPSAGPRERAVAWIIGAIQAFMQGNFDLLETGLDNAVRLADDDEDQRMVAFADLLLAIASGAEGDDEQWQDSVTAASRRLQAVGEPLAVGFGLVASALLARIHGRLAESRRLAQEAHDLSTRIGESYVRVYASTQLARAYLELADWSSAQRYAVESLQAAQRLRNLNAASYALELWATAELHEGRVEQAGWLFGLAERGYRQVGAGPWRTDSALHEELMTDLRAALGSRYEQFLADARDVDLDAAITELTLTQLPGRR
jgi:predicted ATPase